LALFVVTVAPALLIGGHGSAGRITLQPRMQATELQLTPTLVEFGCDEALWADVRNKRALLDLAKNEVKCRKQIEFLRAAVAKGNDGSAPTSRKQSRLNTPFQLHGEAPEGIDVSAVEALLAERNECKRKQDFDGADELRAQLQEMGLYINDKRRTWSKATNPSGGLTLKGPAPKDVDVAAVEAILERRRGAKKARDFEAADELQAELLAMGVFVNDKERTWMAKKVSRQKKAILGPFTLSGPVPEGVDVSVVEAMLAKRVECKKVKDYDGSDKLQAELLKMGVYVKDRERTWEAAQWVQEAAKGAEAEAVEPTAAPAEPEGSE